MGDVINIDGNVESADWAKRSWDIHGPIWDQVNLVAEVNMVAGPPSLPLTKQQRNVDRFMRLPVARAMPPEVRAALERRGLAVPERRGG